MLWEKFQQFLVNLGNWFFALDLAVKAQPGNLRPVLYSGGKRRDWGGGQGNPIEPAGFGSGLMGK